MPAKTVLFTSVRKFDGSAFRWLGGGECVSDSDLLYLYKRVLYVCVCVCVCEYFMTWY